MELLYRTWHWSISGFIIGAIMLLLIYFGKSFGMSSNLRTICSIMGAGKRNSFFDFDWKAQRWNLIVVLGAVIGGFIAVTFLDNGTGVNVSEATINDLAVLQIDAPKGKLIPNELFGLDAMMSVKGFLILLLGGVLVGFGTRYAGGCTSGHAISGLSNLQIPSLIAVIGFFIGGLIMVHLLLPFII
jgi:uncharacterized membrane protein YedE/YeeE